MIPRPAFEIRSASQPSRNPRGASAATDVVSALMDALASADRYRLVERGGELFLVAVHQT